MNYGDCGGECCSNRYEVISWVSRHPLTNGQEAALEAAKLVVKETIALTFGDDPVGELRGATNRATVALVAPMSIGLALLREGYTIVEFINSPSARQKGVFICKGLWVQTLKEGRWVPCPLTPEQQEKGDLTPMGR
jgi:hypothetical protein